MNAMAPRRVRRVEIPAAIESGDVLAEPDYSVAFELEIADADAMTPEQWARATWEGAPGLLRPLLVMGWALVLGLRLGPRPSPEHVLGWRIATSDSNSIVLQSDSPLIAASNIVLVNDSDVVWVTVVRFERRMARLVWAMATPIHLITIPYLLKRASLSRPPVNGRQGPT
jgi:Protein of unknown function (DUF2867)